MRKEGKLVSNIIYMGLFQATNYLVPLVLIPVLVHRIGLEKYGIVALAQGIMMLLTSICDFGFNLTGTRLISQNNDKPNQLQRFISNIISVQLILLLLCGIALYILILLIPSWYESRIIIFTSFVITIGQTLLPVYYFQGTQKMFYLVVLNFLSRVLYITLVLWFIRQSTDAFLINILNGGSAILVAFLGLSIMFKQVGLKPILFKIKEMLSIIRSNYSIFFSSFIVDGYRSSGILLASFILTPIHLGLFSILDKLINLMHNSFAVLWRAIFPRISALVRTDQGLIPAIFRKYYLTFGPLLFISLVFLLIFGDELIALISPEIDPKDITQFLPFVAAYPIFIYANLPVSVSLAAYDYKRDFLALNLFTAIVHVFSILLLAFFFAIKGLLIGYVLAQAMVLIVSIFFLKKKNLNII